MSASGLDADVGTLNLHDVSGGDHGWLVVGSAAEPRGESRTVAFRSADGVEWEVERLPAPEEARAHWASVIVDVGDDLVVVGAAEEGRHEHVVAWRGRPGRDWELVELDDELGEHRGVVLYDGAAVGDDAVIAGAVLDEGGHWSPRIWRLTGDGEATATEGLGDDRDGAVTSVASDGNRLVAAGAIGDPTAYQPPVLFRSSDGGRTWDRVDHQGLDRGTIFDLTFVRGAWWISGTIEGAGSGRAALWRSEDARSWTSAVGRDRRLGTSSINQVVEFGREPVALGDQGLWVSEGGRWPAPWWPGAGEWGELVRGAVHDGLIVAIGMRLEAGSVGLPGLYVGRTVTETATVETRQPWRRVELAGMVLDSAAGVAARQLDGIAGSPDELVVVGQQVEVDGDQVTVGTFAASSADDFRRAEGDAEFAGVLTDVAHTDVGVIATGAASRGQDKWHGARVLGAPGGTAWDAFLSTNGNEDRALQVIPLDDEILITGLTWTDDISEVRTLMWRIVATNVRAAEPEGLDGRGILHACGAGTTVAASLTSGGYESEFAVSTDSGATFTIQEDTPIGGGRELGCAVGPDGRIAVLATGGPEPQLYTFRPDRGRWNEIELPDADRLALAGVQYLPDLGWMLTGSHGGEDNQQAVAYLSDDLTTWTTLGVASDGETGVSDAAISDGQLWLLGSEDGQPTLWAHPIADLPTGGE